MQWLTCSTCLFSSGFKWLLHLHTNSYTWNYPELNCIFSFRVKRHKVKIFSGSKSLFRCFPLGVVRSPWRLFFRLNHLRIVWKRCAHSTFRSQASRSSKSISSGFVPQQQIWHSMRIELTQQTQIKELGYFPLRYLLFKLLTSLRSS